MKYLIMQLRNKFLHSKYKSLYRYEIKHEEYYTKATTLLHDEIRDFINDYGNDLPPSQLERLKAIINKDSSKYK